MEVRVAGVAFEFGLEFAVVANLARIVPLFVGIVVTDVPDSIETCTTPT